MPLLASPAANLAQLPRPFLLRLMNKLQFDPEQQYTRLLNEADEKLHSLLADIDRLRWLRDRIAEEFAEIQKKADTLEIFTEEQLAEAFSLKPEQLSYLRRTLDLPHTRFASQIRYTRRDAEEILNTLSSRNTQPRRIAA